MFKMQENRSRNGMTRMLRFGNIMCCIQYLNTFRIGAIRSGIVIVLGFFDSTKTSIYLLYTSDKRAVSNYIKYLYKLYSICYLNYTEFHLDPFWRKVEQAFILPNFHI